MLVGNNWSGTATIVDANTRTILKTGIDFVPDKAGTFPFMCGMQMMKGTLVVR